jgi:hypothetical protein
MMDAPGKVVEAGNNTAPVREHRGWLSAVRPMVNIAGVKGGTRHGRLHVFHDRRSAPEIQGGVR